MKNFFTILGGMGTLATESFVRVLNSRTVAHTDQEYLNYMLVNHATVPDRTAYILDNTKDSPVTALVEDIKQQNLLNPLFFVLTCNTAHTFYDELQAATTAPILHMPRIAAEKVVEIYQKEDGSKIKVALLATQGTVNSGIYGKEFEADHFELVYPDVEIQGMVMDLIYRDVKEHQFLNKELYEEILQKMIYEVGCDVAVLGCTELSLMYEITKNLDYPIVDAQSEVIDKTLELALANR
ncbi:amino acid racemase [Vagococcus intermedius]|uniref:Amino acid racemase n=1 Tax=Vagococcus intermedius TaxID=2991418 RepID=A0AAF0I8S2_9ENTE|nr:amino acid racemase [Vagococcus intermedius]WEG74281.1 amino acid racemase [Vagococcus intermedius]WEG76363.1 amino acid racemase [Vagococcus intermedius]